MICTKCTKDKDISEFTSRSGGGVYSACRQCLAERQQEIRKSRKEIGLCVKCGSEAKEGRSCCQVCMDHQVALGRRKKESAVKYLGGKCSICGLETDIMAVYDFHHKDPTKKECGIQKIIKGSWEKVRKELDKCELLCSNCHRIVHYKLDGSEC